MAKKTNRKQKGTARRTVKRTITRRAAQSPARRPRGRSDVPPNGPVTLQQARALAIASSPRAAAALVTSPPSPREVGREREDFERQVERERRRRIGEYAATLRIMKARGARRASAAVVARPLQIFAEGDSWFDYPVPFFGGGIIPRLERRLGVPILNLAKAGDEVRFMLGVADRRIIREQFEKGCPAGGRWDAMLFSGGGNDIVDNPMALWIRDYDPSAPPEQQIHQARLDAALTVVRAGYEDLITLRDDLSPGTHLFFHGYDFAIPDGRGVCHLGPWLKPTFDLRSFPALPSRMAVTKVMLQQFAASLQALAAAHDDVTFIDTQGRLSPVRASWHNELHPSKAGFNAFADMFHAELRRVFPGRVF